MQASGQSLHNDLGYIDPERRTLQTIDNPFDTDLQFFRRAQNPVSGKVLGD